MQAHNLDVPNLDILHDELRGRSRPVLEDDPPVSVEDDPPIDVKDDPPASVEYDAPISVTPSDIGRTPSASVVFVFLFSVLAGVGGALAWWYDGGQATNIIGQALPSATSKPTTPPEGFAELQQQINSIAADLAAVRNTLEQQSAANHDQLTRIQEQITQQSSALLSSSPLANKPAPTPLPKPAQHPAHVSTQESSKPTQVARPQSLLPPKQ